MVTSIVNLSLPEGDPNRKIHIHGYQAESYSETMSAPNFEMIDISGRSSPIAYYTGGGSRTVTFSMLFHRDMVEPWLAAIRYAQHPAGIEAEKDSQFTNLFLTDEDTMSLSYEDINQLVAKYVAQWSDYMVSTDRISEDGKWNLGGGGISYEESAISSTRRGITQLNQTGRDWWHASNIQAEINATARFHLFLNKIKALNYPVYTSSGIVTPKVYLKIGGDTEDSYIKMAHATSNGKVPSPILTTSGDMIGGIRLKGYCNANVNYDGIVKYNSLISCSVDFTFTEVVDQAWSATEIIGGMKRYVQWMDQTTR